MPETIAALAVIITFSLFCAAPIIIPRLLSKKDRYRVTNSFESLFLELGLTDAERKNCTSFVFFYDNGKFALFADGIEVGNFTNSGICEAVFNSSYFSGTMHKAGTEKGDFGLSYTPICLNGQSVASLISAPNDPSLKINCDEHAFSCSVREREEQILRDGVVIGRYLRHPFAITAMVLNKTTELPVQAILMHYLSLSTARG